MSVFLDDIIFVKILFDFLIETVYVSQLPDNAKDLEVSILRKEKGKWIDWMTLCSR